MGWKQVAGKEGFVGEHVPGYVALYESGALEVRARILEDSLDECGLCPCRCGVNRNAGRFGRCRTGSEIEIAAVALHPWEEPPVSGDCGSGTIFFSGCTMSCVFCQNYPISQMGVGRSVGAAELAEAMLDLQRRGAHNINLVTSTHQMAGVLQSLVLAVPQGLKIPLVYNTSGYETLETLRLLDGIVDIYLPDIKYSDSSAARFCSHRPDYVEVNRAALVEMWRQAGPLQAGPDGLARRGMLVRHLVLPAGLAGTAESLRFLRKALGSEVWVSLMRQYFPANRAMDKPPLDRKVSDEEYEAAFRCMVEFGIENGFVQMSAEEAAWGAVNCTD